MALPYTNTCAACGKTFQAANHHTRYCSRKCYPEPRRYRSHRIYLLGYIELYLPDHPNAYASGYVREHVVVASRALGKPLPVGAVVHHINGDGTDNRPCNLVICQSNGYHQLLHYRAAQLQEGINPDTEKRCNDCKQIKPLTDFLHARDRGKVKRCRECARLFFRARNRKNYAEHPEWFNKRKGVN